MFIMAAVPNSFSGSPAGSDGASGGSARGRKNGRAGNVFGIPNSSSNSNMSTRSTGGGGASYGASMEAVSGLLEMDENDNSYPWGLIHHNELANMITTGLGKTMVIDSRSFLEYNTSNVQQSVNVSCSKLVKRRLQQDKVHVLDLLHQTCNIGADESWDVVVYDQCTEDPSLLTPDNFVQVLLHKLSTTFNSVAFLKGGFLAFHASHPSLTENKSCSHRCSTLTSLSQPCMPVSNMGPTRILPFLYLGSQQDSLNHELAQVNGISYILNVSKTCPCPTYIQENHFHRIPVNDNYCEKLLPFFEEAFQFLDKVREANGCVLVHCLGGVSRSATLTIAYIMKHMRMSPDEAYRYVKDKRPTISPNFNFLGQLIEYEKLLRQEAVEEERRRHTAKCMALSASSAEECDSTSPAFMDLHSTTKTSPSSPGAKMLPHQAIPSSLDLSVSSLPHSQLASPPTTYSNTGTLESSSSNPVNPALLSHCSLPNANSQMEQSATQECPLPGPDSLDLKTLPSADYNINRQLTDTASREGEQLLLRQKRAGSARRLGLRPTSAPILYTGCLDPQNLPGPLLQHRQLFEAAVRQESGHSGETGLTNVEPTHIPAQSPVCPVTGFPSPGMTHEDLPQSTCPVVTGFPGPDSVDCHTKKIPNSLENVPALLMDIPTMLTIPGSVSTDLTTYQANESNNAQFLVSQDDLSSGSGTPATCADSPGSSAKNLLKGSQQQQQPNKRFSFSSMFSGFRWGRSRPPTLPLSSPVGSMKKHGGELGMVDSRNQLTPVSEAIENSDLNPPDTITSTAGTTTDISVFSASTSSDPILVTELAKEEVEEANLNGSNSNHFNASSQTSGYSSMSLSSSAPSLSISSSEDINSTVSKPGSLRLRAKGFTLALSSPTSNFPVKFSPSSMPSPSDSTNKRKSFLPSSSNSPDKLAKTDLFIPQPISQTGASTIVPPKTLSLAQSTMGKLKQRLSGKKSMALPISSPTAAMAKLNFASPSAEFPASSPLYQHHEEGGELSSKACHHASMADGTANTSVDLTSEDHRTHHKGKGHKREGPKSLFLRKSKWSEERSSLKLEVGSSQKRPDTTLTSSLIGSLSSGSSMSSSFASSRMSLSLSSSTMSSSCYSDMSSSSNMSSSPPPFPTPVSSSSSVYPNPSPLAAAAATTSFHLQGLSEFPTTSLDKLSFTPCYTKDIVQELKHQEATRKTTISGPIPAGDGSAGPSALDSPMSISSGSSAPSVASSTLSPVEAGLTNPFSDGPSHYDVMETLAAYPLPQSPQPIETPLDQDEDENSSALPSFVGSPSEGASISADLSLRSPSDFDPLSPLSFPQATMAPTLPTTPSSFYYSSSSIEPLSPMSLSDNSSSNSPLRSPTRHLQQQHLSQHHQHQQTLWGQDLSIASSFSSCISSVASSFSMPIMSSSSTSRSASSPMSSSITSPSLSSLSQLSSASSTASTSKVVLRKHRHKGADRQLGTCNTGGSSSKHVILDRPNSIAFSHYPTCDLVAPPAAPVDPSVGGVPSAEAAAAAAAPSPASLDDASEVYMSSARRSFRSKHRHQQPGGSEVYARQGRTSWGAYSEREVYRQITAAMETAMLRTHAYGRRLGPGSGRHASKGHHSRKARSLDDILDTSVSDVEFLTGRRVGAGAGARPFASSSRYSGQKEQYPCGMRSGSEPYHSNSSLSSNGSHGSSLEIIQLPR
ncbi:hypothetical protein EGW08_000384 [Elysia chlorotica]|uniref:protein-tyrosine-phosphatase n=1 Tax=Elysia chlorotica TaxID=188477 RepID=A0A3S1A6G1_ELYCH|nr:hypothetical protein EGW08_000384 [Elysia chlorotica]